LQDQTTQKGAPQDFEQLQQSFTLPETQQRRKMMFKKTEVETELGGLATAGSATAAPEPEHVKIPTPPAALTPEMQAFVSASISEAVKGLFAQMGPILQSIALTPEKLMQAEQLRRAPDPAKVVREAREKRLMREEQEENRQNLLRNQALCPHRYPTGATSINGVRNYPDRQPRGICVLCQKVFEPRRWVIGAPDQDNPRGKAYIADADPQYGLVLEALASKG
jgi:hypothetical protein